MGGNNAEECRSEDEYVAMMHDRAGIEEIEGPEVTSDVMTGMVQYAKQQRNRSTTQLA